MFTKFINFLTGHCSQTVTVKEGILRALREKGEINGAALRLFLVDNDVLATREPFYRALHELQREGLIVGEEKEFTINAGIFPSSVYRLVNSSLEDSHVYAGG